jgi:hypothetical protein
MALRSRSRARHTPPASIASQPAVVQRILEIRTDPPENAARVSLGQKPSCSICIAILGSHTPTCACHALRPRVFKILRQLGCIEEDRRRKPRPLESRQPGEEIQFDLKDASHVPADPEGKRKPGRGDGQGASRLSPPSGCIDRSEPSSMLKRGTEVVAQFLREHGLPAMLTFDNDPRLVGSESRPRFPLRAGALPLVCGGDAQCHPAASTRFLPPTLNDFIARVPQECLQVHLPRTHEQVQEATEAYLSHYNGERPRPSHVPVATNRLMSPASSSRPCLLCHRPSIRTAGSGPRQQASLCANHPGWWRCDDQARGLLREPKADWTAGHLLGQRRREAVRDLAATGAHQIDPHQRLARPDHTLRGLCGADEA